jgi:hypothetical protein
MRRIGVSVVTSPPRSSGRSLCAANGEPGRLVYVPAMLAETVRSHVEVSTRLRVLLGEISAINLELLSRRYLD